MTTALSIMIATLLSFISFIANVGAQGEAAWDKEAYEKEVNARFPMVREIADGKLLPPRIKVTWDPIFLEAFDAIEQANGFDTAQAASLMPDAFYYTRWQSEWFPWLYGGLSDWLLDQSMIYHEQDNTIMKSITRVAGVLVKMPTSMHFAAEPMEGDPNDYQFVAYFTYTDGSKTYAKTGVTYNTKTGRIGGEQGMGNLGFNYFVHDDLLSTTRDPWMRKLGYTKIYDDMVLQTTKMTDIDTVRLKFPYDGRDWMIQLWKGRYFNMPGGEVGIYNKPKHRPVVDLITEFYDAASDEDRLEMSFKLTDKRDGAVLIDIPLTLHWWHAGFAAAPKISSYGDQTLETTLVPKDADMMAALKTALDKEVKKGVLTYKPVETKFGPAVHVVW